MYVYIKQHPTTHPESYPHHKIPTATRWHAHLQPRFPRRRHVDASPVERLLALGQVDDQVPAQLVYAGLRHTEVVDDVVLDGAVPLADQLQGQKHVLLAGTELVKEGPKRKWWATGRG